MILPRLKSLPGPWLFCPGRWFCQRFLSRRVEVLVNHVESATVPENFSNFKDVMTQENGVDFHRAGAQKSTFACSRRRWWLVFFRFNVSRLPLLACSSHVRSVKGKQSEEKAGIKSKPKGGGMASTQKWSGVSESLPSKQQNYYCLCPYARQVLHDFCLAGGLSGVLEVDILTKKT